MDLPSPNVRAESPYPESVATDDVSLSGSDTSTHEPGKLYVVEAILHEGVFEFQDANGKPRCKNCYLVKWRGYSIWSATLEPVEGLTELSEVVDAWKETKQRQLVGLEDKFDFDAWQLQCSAREELKAKHRAKQQKRMEHIDQTKRNDAVEDSLFGEDDETVVEEPAYKHSPDAYSRLEADTAAHALEKQSRSTTHSSSLFVDSPPTHVPSLANEDCIENIFDGPSLPVAVAATVSTPILAFEPRIGLQAAFSGSDISTVASSEPRLNSHATLPVQKFNPSTCPEPDITSKASSEPSNSPKAVSPEKRGARPRSHSLFRTLKTQHYARKRAQDEPPPAREGLALFIPGTTQEIPRVVFPTRPRQESSLHVQQPIVPAIQHAGVEVSDDITTGPRTSKLPQRKTTATQPATRATRSLSPAEVSNKPSDSPLALGKYVIDTNVRDLSAPLANPTASDTSIADQRLKGLFEWWCSDGDPLQPRALLLFPGEEAVVAERLRADLRAVGAQVFISQDYTVFETFVKEGTGIVIIHPSKYQLHCLPGLYKVLLEKFSMYVYGSMEDSPFVQLPHRHQADLFTPLLKSGSAIYILEDCFLHDAQNTVAVLARVEDRLRRGQRTCVLGRPNLIDWLHERAHGVPAEAKATSAAYDEAIAIMSRLLHSVKSYQRRWQDRVRRPQWPCPVYFLSEDHWEEYMEYVKSGQTAEMNRCAIDWFGGWAVTHALHYRRFYVLTLASEQAKAVLRQSYGLIEFISPREYVKLEARMHEEKTKIRATLT